MECVEGATNNKALTGCSAGTKLTPLTFCGYGGASFDCKSCLEPLPLS